jgi:Holliday junction resolvasome RuvABC ATP-dependent DNA helicase subunit
MTGIAIDTIENSIEPYLVRKGYIIRTQKGRIIGDI